MDVDDVNDQNQVQSLDDFNILDTLVVCNIVATCNTGVEQMTILPMISRNNLMYYNPAKFHTLKNRFPQSTSRLFETGNVVCTGNKSYADVLITCHTISYLLRRMGEYAVTDCIRTQNIILGATSPRPINLKQLYDTVSESGQCIIYNPAKFPGCIFKSNNPKYTIVTYASGEMIITGCLDYSVMILMIMTYFLNNIKPCMILDTPAGRLTGYNMFSENTIKKLVDTIRESGKDIIE